MDKTIKSDAVEFARMFRTEIRPYLDRFGQQQWINETFNGQFELKQAFMKLI